MIIHLLNRMNELYFHHLLGPGGPGLNTSCTIAPKIPGLGGGGGGPGGGWYTGGGG